MDDIHPHDPFRHEVLITVPGEPFDSSVNELGNKVFIKLESDPLKIMYK